METSAARLRVPYFVADQVPVSAHVDYLDGWRGLAIVLVLLDHFAPTPLLQTGRFGVDVFFCLSGVLMAQILFVQRMPLKLFYTRRLNRILPVFLVYVCVVYGVGNYFGRIHTWVDFLATITFMRSYFPAFPALWGSDLPIGHLWSLNVEEHAYLIMSALTLILWRNKAAMLVGLGCLCFLFHIAYLRWGGPVNFKLHTEVVAANILLSAGYRLIRLPNVKPWMPIVAFAAVIPCYLQHAPWWAEWVLPPFLLAFAVNHLAETPKWVRSALETPALRWMGLLSYSIYLWQDPFYMAKERIGVLAAFALAIATGMISYYLLEKPLRTWLNSRSRPIAATA